jgi:hypothetical protein
MNANDPASGAAAPGGQRGRRFRAAGVIILVLGLVGAGLVWRLGTRPEDEFQIGEDKAATRQVEMLYGQQGLLIENLKEDLQQPGTLAFLTAAVAGILAAGCFGFAHRAEQDDEPR